MEPFNLWADLYDSYYSNKDYEKEVEYVLTLANLHGLSNPKNVLDMGCGTGGHMIPLCEKGLKVKGYDLSERMISHAKEKIIKMNFSKKAEVEVGNAVSYRDGNKYDVVISMFAVMGYLTTNDDFLSGLKTARNHLDKNGLFIFDVWFGPAVLHQLPETRIQEFKNDGLKTIRLVRPRIDLLKQIAEIEYDVLTFQDSKVIQEVKEIHRMRYFFPQELNLFLEVAGFSLKKLYPFMNKSDEPTINDWNISVVAKPM